VETLDTTDTNNTEKRIKRPRPPSPSAIPVPLAPIVIPPRVSITLPPRNSVGPSPAVTFSREPKARREVLARQLPLQEGRKVAFHQPSGKPSGGGKPSGNGGNADTGENWILAVVTKCLNGDKNRWVCCSLRELAVISKKSDTKSRTPSRKRTGSPDCKMPCFNDFRLYSNVV
jgi:hypothetical protein